MKTRYFMFVLCDARRVVSLEALACGWAAQ
jgi:hypothetical protein